MASQSHMDACDFTGSTTLVATNTHAGPTGQAAYYLPCETAGTTLHLSCSHAGHCAAGQVLTVHVSATQHARDTNGTVLLHSDSLAAVMTLLGHRVDASTGFSYLDRGYSSEAAANASLELVWCLEAHCPTSALDFDAAATRDSCRAEVYNLAGFISRKRPLSDYAHSESYYLDALALVPTHCPTLSYLAELYLVTHNSSAAANTAMRLCDACGATSSVALQARAGFDAASYAWPCAPPPSPMPMPPPLPPGRTTVHVVTAVLTVDTTTDTFDQEAFRSSFAAAAGVARETVSLAVVAASVRVTVTVTLSTRSEADAAVTRLTPITASASAASAALGVSVVSVAPPVVSTAVVDVPSSSGAGSGGLVAGVICSVVALLLLAACMYYRHSATASKDARVGAKTPVSLATKTSATTDSVLDVPATKMTSDALANA